MSIPAVQIVTKSDKLTLYCMGYGTRYEIRKNDTKECVFQTFDVSDKGFDNTLAELDMMEANLKAKGQTRVRSHITG